MSEEKEPSRRVTIPSDALRAVLNLREQFPFCRQLLEDVLEIVAVLDASAVQAEIRWRLGSRSKPAARTSLQETIESGVVIAIAPLFLKQEIEKYLPLIAEQTGATKEAAEREWQSVQGLIRFYAPSGDGAEFASVDPKDAPYALTARELDADFVRTADTHFEQMGVPVAGLDLDVVLRDYARATSILVHVKLGSGLALTFGIQAFAEAIQGIANLIGKLPPAVKMILGAALVVALLHPTSREKLFRWLKKTWERLKQAEPVVIAVSASAARYVADAAERSRTTREVIQSKLRVRGKPTALSHARLVCLKAQGPVSAEEIARRILSNGYPSRSKTFASYVRRLLREDPRFTVNAQGHWTLRAAA